ncbi:PAS domain-containing protein [Streptomyces ochraceiscleroticus]|uniref:PAS domain-containing protein n=1 Tax=Streptomyces ochraceiscleroticus TaxID=47761 RepID=A0ABW1MS92_9ACTN|nr:PAS domain-containing protein [Streptomyces ochraceiscleroticus]
MAGVEQSAGGDLTDFRKRVEELRSARALPSQEQQPMLDAALFELQHVVDVLLPRYEGLAAAGRSNGSRAGTEEQQLLRALFQRTPCVVALLDPDTVVRRLNFAGTILFGMRAGYATGRPLTGSMAPEIRAAFRSQVAAVARNEGDRSMVVRLLRTPDGPGEPLRVTMTALRPPGEPGTAVLTVFHTGRGAFPSHEIPSINGTWLGDEQQGDHGEGQRAHLAEVKQGAELMDLLDDTATALLSGQPAGVAVKADGPPAAVERALRELSGRFADWLVLDEMTPAEEGGPDGSGALRRTLVLGPDDSEDLTAALAGQDPARCPLAEDVARTGSSALQVRPDDVAAFGHDAQGAPLLVRTSVTSLLCVPLREAGGPVRGVLTLFRTGARQAFSLPEAGVVDRMSRHLALALRDPRS